MSVEILGLGIATPQHRLDIRTAAKYASLASCEDASQSRKLEALFRRSGVQTRGSVLLEEAPNDQVTQTFYAPSTGPGDRGPTTSHRGDRFAIEAPILAIASARKALDQSGVAASEITHLVTVTCTGFSAPGVDIELIDGLGLPATTERVQVGFMGCHGSINGMRAARGLVAADPSAKVLMTSVELCSLHYQYGFDADRIVSGALFADGSGSLVVANSESKTASKNGSTNGSFNGNGTAHKIHKPLGLIAATGSCLIADSRGSMTWRIGDNGFEMTLAATVPGLIENGLREFLTDWLGKHGESIESIGGWAVHPGGARILTAVETALDFDTNVLSVSRDVLAEHGNMSSATMLFILQQFAKIGRPKPWLMLGFGPGLEIEVALIR
jgi:predicted naringenin-chalcone synthase